MTVLEEPRIVAEGLVFPEGPVALPSGDLLVCETGAGWLTRIDVAAGTAERIVETGGGPNGAALGADGAVYVCNNGGWPLLDLGGLRIPEDVNQAPDYTGGSLQRVDLGTGEVTTLYDGLRSPNDIVVDADGGLWFTDYGKQRERDEDRGFVYYARPDGSQLVEVASKLIRPNGIGLSPDGAHLYVAETPTGRLWSWEVVGPGELGRSLPFGSGGTLVGAAGGLRYFDSLAVEAEGRVCVGTLVEAGITIFTPGAVDAEPERVALPGPFADPLPTNLCFAGDDMRTVYVTLSGTGRVLAGRWPRPGLRLAW